jgi:hypothetical protein
MLDSYSSRGSSHGADARDGAAARLDAQHQAFRDMADWFEKVPDSAHDSFFTVTLTLGFALCREKANTGAAAVRASCRWTASAAPAPGAVTPPAGKTSAFGPSSRFTLLGDQYYEAAGTARGEDNVSYSRACTDARKKARHQAMESASKAGLCDREDWAMQIAMSFAPPVPALIGGGRYGINAFEAVCEWNLIIEAVSSAAGDPDSAGTVASGSVF